MSAQEWMWVSLMLSLLALGMGGCFGALLARTRRLEDKLDRLLERDRTPGRT